MTITAYACATCGAPTEWDFALGSEPRCVKCWDAKAATYREKAAARLFTASEDAMVVHLRDGKGLTWRKIGRELARSGDSVRNRYLYLKNRRMT